jgi:hypothetical protein
MCSRSQGVPLTAGEADTYNVDPKVGADQRGHGIGVSLDVYTQSDTEEKRAAVNTLEAALA